MATYREFTIMGSNSLQLKIECLTPNYDGAEPGGNIVTAVAGRAELPDGVRRYTSGTQIRIANIYENGPNNEPDNQPNLEGRGLAPVIPGEPEPDPIPEPEPDIYTSVEAIAITGTVPCGNNGIFNPAPDSAVLKVVAEDRKASMVSRPGLRFATLSDGPHTATVSRWCPPPADSPDHDWKVLSPKNDNPPWIIESQAGTLEALIEGSEGNPENDIVLHTNGRRGLGCSMLGTTLKADGHKGTNELVAPAGTFTATEARKGQPLKVTYESPPPILNGPDKVILELSQQGGKPPELVGSWSKGSFCATFTQDPNITHLTVKDRKSPFWLHARASVPEGTAVVDIVTPEAPLDAKYHVRSELGDGHPRLHIRLVGSNEGGGDLPSVPSTAFAETITFNPEDMTTGETLVVGSVGFLPFSDPGGDTGMQIGTTDDKCYLSIARKPDQRWETSLQFEESGPPRECFPGMADLSTTRQTIILGSNPMPSVESGVSIGNRTGEFSLLELSAWASE